MTNRPDPFREPDNEARALARSLLTEARIAAIAVTWEGAPYVARVAIGQAADGAPMTLVSDLSHHTVALHADPTASLLIGEAKAARGDPLTRPRMTLQGRARFVDKAAHRDLWLAQHPKAKLYIDFTDFHFVRFDVTDVHLNGGFGKAFRLTARDLVESKSAPGA